MFSLILQLFIIQSKLSGAKNSSHFFFGHNVYKQTHRNQLKVGIRPTYIHWTLGPDMYFPPQGKNNSLPLVLHWKLFWNMVEYYLVLKRTVMSTQSYWNRCFDSQQEPPQREVSPSTKPLRVDH